MYECKTWKSLKCGTTNGWYHEWLGSVWYYEESTKRDKYTKNNKKLRDRIVSHEVLLCDLLEVAIRNKRDRARAGKITVLK